MPKVTTHYLSVILFILFSMLTVKTALAGQIVRAYVLLETPVKLETVKASNGGMSNCKPLFHRIFSGEILVHVQCSDMKDLNKAITDQLSQTEGLTNMTIMRITAAR